MYLMYAACYVLWLAFCFPKTYSRGSPDVYFFYVNLLEFLVFLYFRTRSTIKYLPKFITILNICFLMYINSYMYAAIYEAYSVLFETSMFLIIFFIKYYEQPAVMNWNPFGSYTPSINNTRAAY
mmetsp:Transcript_32124/g.23727  ORF Transcript_32124/g.23727 Transcript_32124/m.23727 type:complete len:124 (+) Transcript_32124:819-1190(+)